MSFIPFMVKSPLRMPRAAVGTRREDQFSGPRPATDALMTENATDSMTPEIERMRMDVDIVCVGFGPATAGFLTTLNRALVDGDGQPRFESTAAPGMPLQVLCYERADDIGFGVSGVVTRARAIRASFPPASTSTRSPWPPPSRARQCSTCSIRARRADARGRCAPPTPPSGR